MPPQQVSHIQRQSKTQAAVTDPVSLEWPPRATALPGNRDSTSVRPGPVCRELIEVVGGPVCNGSRATGRTGRRQSFCQVLRSRLSPTPLSPSQMTPSFLPPQACSVELGTTETSLARPPTLEPCSRCSCLGFRSDSPISAFSRHWQASLSLPGSPSRLLWLRPMTVHQTPSRTQPLRAACGVRTGSALCTACGPLPARHRSNGSGGRGLPEVQARGEPRLFARAAKRVTL